MATTKENNPSTKLPDLQVDKQAPTINKNVGKSVTDEIPLNDNNNEGETMDSSNKGKGPAGENL